MSFKGVVTRKEKEAGVDLLAKIVTENKKKSTKQTYKVRISSNGLSDNESCSRAVILKKEEISSAGPGGAEDLTVSINLNSLGAFGTTLSYRIINDTTTNPLTDYLSSNGTLLGCPVYGAGDSTGKLYITASKNDASITAIVPITVKAYTAESILSNEDIINKSALWKAMAGNNPEYTLSNNKITFLADWNPWKLINPKPSNQAITVSYTVEDKINGSIGQSRIDSVTAGVKTVYQPTYTSLRSIMNYSTDYTVNEHSSTTQAGKLSKILKCDGLIVTATLTLGDATVVYEYNITTIGQALTNQEIIDAIQAKAEGPTTNGNIASTMLRLYRFGDLNSEIGGYYMTGTTPGTKTGAETFAINCINIAPATVYNIKCLTGSDFEAVVSLPSLGLSEGEIEATISTPQQYAFDGQSTYMSDESISNSVFSSSDVLPDNVIPVNLSLIKSMITTDSSVSDAALSFSIKQTITCSKYEGTPKQLQLMKWFTITNISSLT